MTRREFVAAAAVVGVVGAAGFAGGSSAAHADDTVFDWKTVAGPVRAGFGFGGNSTLIPGKEVAYLIDTKNSPFGTTLRRAATAAGLKVVVINTHHHADHTGGNHAFTKDCTVLAHENCAPRIENNVNRYISGIKEAVGAFQGKKGPEIEQAKADWHALYKDVTKLKSADFKPNETMGASRTIDTPGGAKLELRHFGPGHTDNDMIVFIPDHNVLVAGDLLFHKVHPYVDPDGGGTPSGWVESLKKAIAMCDSTTRVVPGHGVLCGVEGLKDQVNYFDKVRAAVEKAVKAGRSRKEVGEMRLSFPGYANPDRAPMALLGVYDELTKK
jgi:cyclase